MPTQVSGPGSGSVGWMLCPAAVPWQGRAGPLAHAAAWGRDRPPRLGAAQATSRPAGTVAATATEDPTAGSPPHALPNPPGWCLGAQGCDVPLAAARCSVILAVTAPCGSEVRGRREGSPQLPRRNSSRLDGGEGWPAAGAEPLWGCCSCQTPRPGFCLPRGASPCPLVPRPPPAQGPAPPPLRSGAEASSFITLPSISDKNRLPRSTLPLSRCYVNAALPAGESLVSAGAARCRRWDRGAVLAGSPGYWHRCQHGAGGVPAGARAGLG